MPQPWAGSCSELVGKESVGMSRDNIVSLKKVALMNKRNLDQR